jgi:O-antigen/teichoic acid export membrane protein
VPSTEDTIDRAEIADLPRRHLASGTLFATGANVAPLAASAGLSLAIARLYGPTGTGVMSLVVNLFDAVLMIFTIGLSTGVTYLVSRGEWPLSQASRQLRRAAAGLGLCGAASGIGFYFLTRQSIFKGVAPVLAIVSLCSLPFAISWALSAAIALGRERYEAYAGLELSQSLVVLLAGVALAVAFGLTGAVAAFAAANVVTAVLGGLWTRRELKRRIDSAAGRPLPGGQLRRATSFGLQTWTANLLQLLNYRVDLFFVSAVAPRSAVGVYSIAVSVTALGWLLPNALQTVLFPRVASLHAATGAGRVTSDTADAAAARAIRHSVLMLLPTALILAVLVLLVPLFYGSRFDPSVALGFILIPGVVALGLAKVVSAVFTGRGFPRYALYTTVITVPVTLGLYFALIPTFHAVGAAVASSISYVLTTVVSCLFLRRATVIPLRDALIPRRSDVMDYRHALRLTRARLGRA